MGPSSFSGYNGTVFEPNDEWKGDFARIYFYALTRWDEACEWRAGNGNCFFSGNLDKNMGLTDYGLGLMLKWHQQDPVSAYEIKKNNAAVQLQGNRNPYVDHPEWVNSIWGGSYSESKPTSLSLSCAKTSILVGQTVTLSLSSEPSNASKRVTFASSNPSVASVSKEGNVKGLSLGKTVITATSTLDSSVSASIEITVKEAEPVALSSISAKDVTVNEGKSAQIEVTSNPVNVNPLPTYTYEVADSSIASVSASGIVTGLKMGKTTVKVTAKQGNITAATTLNVFVNEKGENGYTKIKNITAPGSYLIVAESASRVLDGGVDLVAKNAKNQFDVTIKDGHIANDGKVDLSKACFTIEKSENGYAIRTQSGDYMAANKSADLTSKSLPAYNTISINNNGQATIKYNGLTLQYNQGLFRYYSNAGVGSLVSLYLAG